MAQTVLDKEKLDTKENIDEKLNNDIPIENKTTDTSSLRKYIPLICVAVGIVLFICIFSTAFALVNNNSSKIVEGVSVNGINLSGLTTDEATQKLTDEFSKKLDATLTLSCGDYSTELIPSQDIEANYDVSAAVEKAYSIGRSGNLIQNNYEILVSLLATQKITVNLQYNSDKLDAYIDNISTQIPGLVEQPSYYIEDSNLIIVRGNSGVQLLQDETKNLVLSNIDTLTDSNSIEMLTKTVEPDKVDINKIHEEIYSEPENAYIIQDPFELSVGSSGTDFAISIDEAQNLLSEEKDEYIIPLKMTPPEIGVEDLGNNIFVHNLGTFTSYYKESNVNRSTNVKLATNKINSVILLPGEEFSYNKIVGERTFENGFKEASVYTSSGVVNGLGGGICQVSSTLYNSVLLANLEIVERRNHRYAVSYVPLGRDATVAYGSIDFRFKNNRKYPIKIVASSANGVCTVSIMGIKEEVEYEVSITTNKLQTIPYETKYIEDSTLASGTQKQTQYGDYGYKYETYKTLKLNGEVVSTELISNDTYTPLTRVVKVGTKQAQVTTPSTNVTVDTNTNNNNASNDNSGSTDNSSTENNGDTSETPSEITE